MRRKIQPMVRSGAWRTVAAAVLCALVLCACSGIEAEPTPAIGSAESTQIRSSADAVTPSPAAAASRNNQLSQGMFSSDLQQVGTAGRPSAQRTASAAPQETAAGTGVHMRAAWIATVLNIDFPSVLDDPQAQQAEFEDILDHLVAWGLDTAIVQVRPMGDALYESALNPWSSFLTGTQGQDPGWDPLSFMIDEAHARGISLHAWLNPYRVTHSSVRMTLEDLAEDSLARQHPEWLIEHENVLYYDPAREEVKQHIVDTVREIVDNYDVDGIHFDDYFYPAEYPLPDGAERDGIIAQERRANVNEMIRRVNEVCENAPHKVVFGVSPFGIWKNSTTDPAGSDTSGNESYYAMAADSVRWIREEIIDYIAPQLYWPIGHERADYATLAHWWAQQIDGTDVSLIIGQGIYAEENAAQITAQLELNATIPQITGSIFFSYQNLLDDSDVSNAVQAFYATERNDSNASSVEQSETAGNAGSGALGADGAPDDA